MEHFLGLIQTTLADHPLAAPIIFIAAHTLMAIFFLPCSPMTLIAGALWGGIYGLLISMVAAIVSTATTFLLSRSLLHRKIEHFLTYRYPRAAALLNQAAIHDWKIIAIAQINPLIPASTMGYVFGLSQIAFSRYLLFSIIFMLPLQALFVMTGHSAITLLASDDRRGAALALIFLVAILPLVTRRIYRKLSQLLGGENGA